MMLVVVMDMEADKLADMVMKIPIKWRYPLNGDFTDVSLPFGGTCGDDVRGGEGDGEHGGWLSGRHGGGSEVKIVQKFGLVLEIDALELI